MKNILSATTLALLLATSATAQYCATSVSNPCGGNEYISNVTCGTINNTSACGAGYEDYSAQSVTFPSGGSSFPINVTVSSWFSATDTCSVFVDWNGDFAFNTTTERTALVQGVGSSAATHYTGTITAPAGQAAGSYRMRVFMNYGSTAIAPCGAFTFGNLEDYTAVVGAPTPPTYQLNQAGASFTLDGIASNGYTAAQKNATADNCTTFGATTAAFTSTNLGSPWDLAIGTVPAVPSTGPGFVLNAGPQKVNINLTDPTLVFLNAFPALATPFPGNFSLVYAPGGPTFAVAQMLVIDGAQIDGVSLSQASNYNCTFVLPGANPAPPTGDDATVVLTYQGVFGGCSATAFSFFGTSYTQFGLTTNGRVMPGNNTSTAYFPAQVPAEPTIGAWCDLNQSTNGTITVSSPSAGVARVDFNAVGFFGGTIGSNGVTMGIEMDCNTGNITMDSFLLATGGGSQFFGIAKGAGGTDPGPAGPFDGAALGAYAGPGLPTDNIYYYGTEGAAVINGLSALVFTASLTGGSYDWVQY